MSRMTPFSHPLRDSAVPMIGVNRLDFMKRLEENGWEVAMDGPSGIYYKDPFAARAMWISWEFEHEGRNEWYTEMIDLKSIS